MQDDRLERTGRAVVREHMPELDAVRGAAVVLVVLAHLFGWSLPGWTSMHAVRAWPALATVFGGAQFAGWVAVQAFFALSGFLITVQLFRRAHRRDYYRHFFVRRACRLQPAFLLTLALVVAFGLVQWGVQPTSLSQVGACALFAANLSPVVGIENPYGPFWTLALEEQFYLLWPAVVRRHPRRALAVVCGLVLLAGPLIRLAGWCAGVSWQFTSVTWFNLDALAAGGLLAACLVDACVPRAMRMGAALGGVGATLLIMQAATGQLQRSSPIGSILFSLPWTLLVSGGMSWLLAAGTRWPIGQGAIGRLLRFFGFVSYGLYLYHLLVMHALDRLSGGWLYLRPWERPQLEDATVRVACVFALSTAVAYLSRVHFEAWFLQRTRSAERRVDRLARRGRRWLGEPIDARPASMIAPCPPSASTTRCPARPSSWHPSPARPDPSPSTAAARPSTTTRTSATSAAS